ncbi:MAG: SAM-dependent methyltransferase [Bacteroidota bacterium]
MNEVATLPAFWQATKLAIDKARFVKLTLGKSRYRDTPKLNNIYVRPVELKGQVQLQLTFHYADRDEVKNYGVGAGITYLAEQLGGDFLSADMFSLDEQLSVKVSRKGKPHITRSAARHREAAMSIHNRQKERLIAEDRSYLSALGIADAAGNITPTGQKKYKQINKFVEIVDGLLRQQSLPEAANIVDMGSGKGYLTFALYDHLRHNLGMNVHVTGVELRPNLVEKCNRIARENNFDQLQFVEGYIDSYQPEKIDMIIALHACDTATDDALIQGIRAGATMMIVAPCCQKQVRRSMKPPPELQAFLQHGILLERQASMLTDALRALYLESVGYRTKVFEFITLEHTAKNVMITAVKGAKKPTAMDEALQLKKQFGIQRHRLEELLAEG